MKALVTGGAGFIGSHVCDLLVTAGHEVHVLDDLSNGKVANVPAGASLHRGSITDAAFVNELFAAIQPDVVCHLAAQVSVIESLKDPFNDVRRNIDGSINLILAARANGQPKIVYASTGGAIYGDPEESAIPVDETYPARPLSPYGITKHTVEHYLEAEAANHGQRYTVVRFGNVYGPRQDPHGEAGVVAIFTVKILEGSVCKVFGDGEQTRDFVYVGDVARAVVAAIDGPDGQMFNVGTGNEVTVNEVVAALREAWGADFAVEHAPARVGEVKRIALCIDKARAQLGWSPQLTFREGIKATLDSYRS